MKHVNPSELKIDPYKMACELRITEDERRRLIDLIPRLSEIPKSDFSMKKWTMCIKGHMYSDVAYTSPQVCSIPSSMNIYVLFGSSEAACWQASGCVRVMTATRKQASVAIQHFLIYGPNPKLSMVPWHLRFYFERLLGRYGPKAPLPDYVAS